MWTVSKVPENAGTLNRTKYPLPTINGRQPLCKESKKASDNGKNASRSAYGKNSGTPKQRPKEKQNSRESALPHTLYYEEVSWTNHAHEIAKPNFFRRKNTRTLKESGQ
jgi:hypothetical protein